MSKAFQEALEPRLQTQVWGRTHRHVACTGSTNDDIQAWMDAGAPHGALVTADAQSQGRGRMGRSWESTASQDIYASVALRVHPGPAGIGALGLAVGLGLVRALHVAYPELGSWSLKWPNDVMVDGKKLGGILCEARWTQGQALIACGFGLNVGRLHFEDSHLAQRATSLALLAQKKGKTLPLHPRVSLLAQLMLSLENTVEPFLKNGFSCIAEPYKSYCRELGQTVRLSGSGPDKGPPGTLYRAIDLDEDGALLVQRPPQLRAWRVQSDDVWLVAPEGQIPR